MSVAGRQTPSLWRNKDFLALWGGQIVSTLGTRISATALPLLVLAMTGSPANAGLVGAAGSLPYLLIFLPAGTLVDRWNRRRIMLVSQITACVALASIPVALWLDVFTISQLTVVAFAQGTCFVFYDLAEKAALPRIVPPSLLPSAIAQNEAKGRGASLAGPPLGGLLFGLGHALPFLTNALSHMVAMIGLLFVRSDLQDERSAPRDSFWNETRAGLRWLWRQPLVRAAVLLVAASNMIFSALSLALVVLARRQGASPAEIGLMLGVYGGGGLIGALVAGRLHSRFSPKTVIIGVNWIWAAVLPVLAVAPNPLSLGVVAAMTSAIGPMWNVVIGTYQLTLVPNDMLGRVGSASMTLAWGVMPLGSLIAGFLLDTLGPVGTILVLALGMLLTAVAATASPAVRHAPPLPAAPTGVRIT
ncbi:MFS transporter [Microtetraspora sp. AC03309]|uniref:MFS transporter n=1 Tax=Microtetraspora sp. AC03309 TaxID=2779376 RepID=UPI001E635C4D|nr:MFS transporter [Microtetraspora sp. AC03309]MCC5576551.1 MFS transporter [Microtetraspora sp. AC03309]